MIELLDGPAAGHTLSLRSAPHFLRVVIDSHGDVDALDQPEDELGDDETIHVYVMEVGTWTQVFVRPGGRYEGGRYRYMNIAGDEDELRTISLASRDEWIAWVKEHGNRAAVARGLDPWNP